MSTIHDNTTRIFLNDDQAQEKRCLSICKYTNLKAIHNWECDIYSASLDVYLYANILI